MFKLKGKTLFLLAVIVVGFAGVGFFFYNSVTSLNEQVEQGMLPQKRTKYLKEIALNVNKLNNLYLVDSIRFSAQKADTIISIIERNLDSIKLDYYHTNTISNKNLDTIPKLLKIIQLEYLQLEKERLAGQRSFINDLEGMLQDELAELNLSSRDSVTIIKQITSEIYSQDLEIINDISNTSETEERKSFFQRLFGGSSRKDEPKSNPEKPHAVVPEKQRDTLISTKVDTLLNVSNTAPPETKIISIFENIQRKRINFVDNLKVRESEIFQKNIQINSYIETVINDIIFDEINSFNTYVDNFSNSSKQYVYKSTIIILIFMIIGIISTYVILKDINKSIFFQKQIEENEKRALREADEKQRFLYTMSHELRTPLTSIIGYSEVLDQNDENVQAIKTASDYLYQMTNEILDMAKIKAGIIEIDNAPFNLNEVLNRIKTNFKPLIKQKGLQSIFEFEDTPIFLISDQHRLQQIIYNLMHNAVKFTDTGFIKMGYTAEQLKEDIVLNVYIEDSGCGMSAEEQVAIFKDYHQAGTHKNKIKGTGLGMGIVKTLVDKMGGSIYVKSELNKGTRFDLQFKFKKTDETQINELPQEIILPDNALEGKKIYVLDDDELITRLYQKILNSFEAEVITENNSLDAKNHLLENHNYDMVIFDLKMPQLNGNELLEHLIAQNVKPRNCVISTANVLISEQDKADLKIFDYQIYKPIKRQDLVRLLVDAFNIEFGKATSENSNKNNNDLQTKFSHSLEHLKAFIGNDKDELFETLQLMLTENQKELQLLEQQIINNNHLECANIIHKIASRFAQLNIESPVSPKETESALRQVNPDSLYKAQQLCEFWDACNIYLKQVYKTKQQL